jgi:hypothetical protein
LELTNAGQCAVLIEAAVLEIELDGTDKKGEVAIGTIPSGTALVAGETKTFAVSVATEALKVDGKALFAANNRGWAATVRLQLRSRPYDELGEYSVAFELLA